MNDKRNRLQPAPRAGYVSSRANQRLSIAIAFAMSVIAGCGGGEDVNLEEPGELEVQGQSEALTEAALPPFAGARTIARNYRPPRGPQGVADSPAYAPMYNTEVDPDYDQRIQRLANMGANITWGCAGWAEFDRVDELNGQAPTAANCKDDPNQFWAKSTKKRVMKLVPGGPDYCIDLGAVQRCAYAIRRQTYFGLNSVMAIYNTPRAYSRPECLAKNVIDSGVTNGCAPSEQGKDHMARFVTFMAKLFDGKPHPEYVDPDDASKPFCRDAGRGDQSPYCGKLTDFIAFNEVSSNGYFDISGMDRPGGRGGKVDTTRSDLPEAEKRLWGEEYANVMLRIHNALQAAQRTDVMLWTSFNCWFKDHYTSGGRWLINNQYILDALKSKLGLNIDWGIGIHPYDDPSPYWRGGGYEGQTNGVDATRTGPNPQHYVLGNLNALSTQMANWLSTLQPSFPASDYPQSKIFASEQSYTGPRSRKPVTSTFQVPYAYEYERDETRIAEWVCRAHDEVLDNRSIVAVTHIGFQADQQQQKDQQSGKGGEGLIPADITHNPWKDRALTPAVAVGDVIDMNRDFVMDGTALSTTSVQSYGTPCYTAGSKPIPCTWPMPPAETKVLNSFAATFNDSSTGWRQQESPCCSEFYLGCLVTPAAANAVGVIDGVMQMSDKYTLTGRACLPKRDAPAWVDVWTDAGYVAGGPANDVNDPSDVSIAWLPSIRRGRLACANNYKDQRFNIKFTRSQIAQHQGKVMEVRVHQPQYDVSNRLIGTAVMPALPANYNGIRGRVDELVVDTNLITLRGWACASGLGDSINVHVYSSTSSSAYPMGTFVKEARADFLSEPALQSQCLDGSSAHRFEISFTRSEVLNHQGKSLHVYAISPVGGTNDVLQRPIDFKMPALPAQYQMSGTLNGRVELLLERDAAGEPLDGGPRLTGWACMHNDASKLGVHVYSGDSWNSPTCAAGQSAGCKKFIKMEIADALSEPALNTLCNDGGKYHRFEIPFTKREQIDHEARRLHVFALHPTNPNGNIVLPRRQDFFMPAPVGPDIIFGDSYAGKKDLFQVWYGGDAVRFLAPGDGSSCPSGYQNVGAGNGSSTGFWLCATDTKGSYYVGDVENDIGFYYSVSSAGVNLIGTQSWGTCIGGSKLISTAFWPNGFWVCAR